MSSVITINKPMVLVPVDEYLALLKESGEKPAKELLREIKNARKELKSGKSVSWGSLKNELGI